MIRRLVFASLLALGVQTLARHASADTSPATLEPEPASELRYPVARAERPLTLPKLVVSSELGAHGVSIRANDVYANLDLSAAVGVSDDVSVRALVVPLQISGPPGDGFHYGETSEDRGPSIGVTVRLVHGPLELGLSLDLRLFTAKGLSGVAILPAVPLRIHLAKWARLDAAPALDIWRATMANTFGFGSVPADVVRFQLPVSLLFNLVEPVHVGVMSGVTIYDLSDVARTTGIPVGVFGGYTVASAKGPVLDIDPFFTFPYRFWSGPNAATESEYLVGVNLRGFFYL